MTTGPARPPTDFQQPDDVREPEPMRPLRKFQPEIQALIRHLIKIGDLTAVIQHGEPCIRLSEMVHYTAGGRSRSGRSFNSRHQPIHRSTRNALPRKSWSTLRLSPHCN